MIRNSIAGAVSSLVARSVNGQTSVDKTPLMWSLVGTDLMWNPVSTTLMWSQ